MKVTDDQEIRIVLVESVEVFKIIAKVGPDVLRKEEAMVCTKYNNMEKKMKPTARLLPANS